MAPIQIGYWNLRGLAEPISYLLRHVDADYEIKRLQPGEETYKTWLQEKKTMDLDFPNLPYLIDGEVRLTQSLAIIRYLARKFKLAGNNEAEVSKLDLVEQQARDLQMGLIQIIFSPSFEEQKVQYLESLPSKLEAFSEYLGDRDWMVGDSVTYVDFLAYEALDFNRMFAKEIFDKYPNLKEFLKRVESLPNIKKYMESEAYKKWPIFAPFAPWGGKGDLPQ